ncbi:MAG: type III secretion system chaperone [Pseudomonadota bacterium]
MSHISVALLLTAGLAACSIDEASDLLIGTAHADDDMTAERLGELVLAVDEKAELEGNSWYFRIEGLETSVVYDIEADRMRIIIPIVPTDDLEPDILMRMLQANYDSALDARYAVANGMVWGTFIHPLSTLSDEEFLVGLAQTANVVITFGGTYTSGMFLFGGGDSSEIERQQLIEELKKKQRT